MKGNPLSSVLLGLLALGLVGAATWLLLPQRDVVAPQLAQTPSDAGSTNTADPEVAPTAPESGIADAAPARSNARPQNATSQGQPPLPPPPLYATWRHVLVVDSGTQQPVADASVHFYGATQSRLLQDMPPAEQRRLQYNQSDMALELGWTTTTNEQGLANVAYEGDYVVVMAEKDGRFGVQTLSFTAAAKLPQVVTLEEDLTLFARVIRADGTPAADVPLHLVRHEPSGSNALAWFLPLMRSTDANGEAVFRHAQATQRLIDPTRGRARQWRLVAGLPRAERGGGGGGRGRDGDRPQTQELLLAPKDLAASSPEQPITVTLADQGALHVRLLLHGKPMPPPLSVSAQPVSQATTGFFAKPTLTRDLPASSAGWVIWPYVPLQQSFVVSAGPWHTTLVGPIHPGGVATHEIELSDHIALLAGRAIDVDGRPLRNVHMMAYCELECVDAGGSPSQPATSLQFATDGDGHFLQSLWPIPPGHSTKLSEITFTEVPAPNVDGRLPAPRKAEVRNQPLRNGTNELGDIRFAAPTQVCSGRLRIGDRPVTDSMPDVAIRIERFAADEDSGEPWQPVTQVHIDIRKDLAFSVHGKLDPGRYRVRAEGFYTLPSAAQEFELGATDLVIHVPEGTIVAVAASLPAEVQPLHFQLHIKPQTNARPVIYVRHEWMTTYDGGGGIRENGHANWNSCALEAGNYVLEVTSTAGMKLRRPFAVPPGVRRLQLEPLDLRSHIYTLTLDVHFEASAKERKQRGIYALTVPERSAGAMDTAPLAATNLSLGRNVLAMPASARGVILTGPGVSPYLLKLVAGNRARSESVQLRFRPEINLVLPTELTAQLPEDTTFVAEATPLGELAVHGQLLEWAVQPKEVKLPWGTSPIEAVMATPAAVRIPFANGEATLVLSDAPHSLKLFAERGPHTIALRQFSPKQLPAGGSSQSNYAVQLSLAEIERFLKIARK
ncbi:MAG: hypothetical protein AB8H80_00885 [Planctomycetota bacterium]